MKGSLEIPQLVQDNGRVRTQPGVEIKKVLAHKNQWQSFTDEQLTRFKELRSRTKPNWTLPWPAETGNFTREKAGGCGNLSGHSTLTACTTSIWDTRKPWTICLPLCCKSCGTNPTPSGASLTTWMPCVTISVCIWRMLRNNSKKFKKSWSFTILNCTIT